MSIYQLGLLKKWPHIDSDKIKLSFYFLKHGEKISTSRTKEQMEETRNFILDTIRDINEKIKDNNNFHPLRRLCATGANIGRCARCGSICIKGRTKKIKSKIKTSLIG